MRNQIDDHKWTVVYMYVVCDGKTKWWGQGSNDILTQVNWNRIMSKRSPRVSNHSPGTKATQRNKRKHGQNLQQHHQHPFTHTTHNNNKKNSNIFIIINELNAGTVAATVALNSYWWS